jgi:hypothetical protein
MRRSLFPLAGLLALFLSGTSVRANVYATDIQLNGSLNAGILVPGGSVTISYILNEYATAGVSLQIFSGTNIVKTFTAAGGRPGTFAGRNSFQWNGGEDNGSNVPPGIYTLGITAAANGYNTWTSITDDSTNFDVFFPTSITVNKNTNSPYYGRVFIGNCVTGGTPQIDQGILKRNADGSAADEGGAPAGGYVWNPAGYIANPSPWKMAISADDRLYVDDWSGSGVVVSFDQVLSTNYQSVLRPDNYPYSGIFLSGPFISGEGTNTQIWMADINPAPLDGLGVLRWDLDAGGTLVANDTGTIIVGLGGASALTYAPFDVAVDTNGYIYVIQQVSVDGNSMFQDTDPLDMRVFCFPPFQNGNSPETNALWQVGRNNPSLENAAGLAADPTESLLAVAALGEGSYSDGFTFGGISIFQTADGLLVTNINQDPAGNANQAVIDVAWDNVGNLYDAEFNESIWRVYSPPGPNQATTVAAPIIQAFDALLPPTLTNSVWAAGQLGFMLGGQSNVTYVIQQSPDLVNWTPIATNYSPTPARSITVPFADNQDFYRAVVSP